MSEYTPQLLAVEAKLAKDPNNEDLLSLKADLQELIELSNEVEFEDQQQIVTSEPKFNTDDPQNPRSSLETTTTKNNTELDNDNIKKKKKKKNKKKESRLNMREQFGESEKQSWQSFAKQKGLKGICKKSIFASPLTTKGKVGVGTNGIADAPSATLIGINTSTSSSASSSSQQLAKKKY